MDRISQPFQSKSICDGFSNGLVRIHIFWMENFTWVGLSAWTFALKLLLLLLVTVSMPMLKFTCMVRHQNRSSFYFNVGFFFFDETLFRRRNIQHRVLQSGHFMLWKRKWKNTAISNILYSSESVYVSDDCSATRNANSTVRKFNVLFKYPSILSFYGNIRFNDIFKIFQRDFVLFLSLGCLSTSLGAFELSEDGWISFYSI